MKKLIWIAAFFAASSQCFAADIWLSTPTETITLSDVKCPTGGQEATSIEKRSNGGGAYGCWERHGDEFIINWTTSVGPTGSILKVNYFMKYKAPSTLR